VLATATPRRGNTTSKRAIALRPGEPKPASAQGGLPNHWKKAGPQIRRCTNVLFTDRRHLRPLGSTCRSEAGYDSFRTTARFRTETGSATPE